MDLASVPWLTEGEKFIIHSKVDDNHRHSDKYTYNPNGGTLWSSIKDFQANLADFRHLPSPSILQTAGFTINGVTNSCWQHFNRGTAAFDMKRVDYMMYRNAATPIAMQVQGPYPDWHWTWQDDGITRDLSDHYPLQGTFSIG
jgi:hypothetical protein